MFQTRFFREKYYIYISFYKYTYKYTYTYTYTYIYKYMYIYMCVYVCVFFFVVVVWCRVMSCVVEWLGGVEWGVVWCGVVWCEWREGR